VSLRLYSTVDPSRGSVAKCVELRQETGLVYRPDKRLAGLMSTADTARSWAAVSFVVSMISIRGG
jgi:hypothetical protein